MIITNYGYLKSDNSTRRKANIVIIELDLHFVSGNNKSKKIERTLFGRRPPAHLPICLSKIRLKMLTFYKLVTLLIVPQNPRTFNCIRYRHFVTLNTLIRLRKHYNEKRCPGSKNLLF